MVPFIILLEPKPFDPLVYYQFLFKTRQQPPKINFAIYSIIIKEGANDVVSSHGTPNIKQAVSNLFLD